MILEKIRESIENRVSYENFLFETNDEETQKRLTGAITEVVESFLQNGKIGDYKIICNGTNNNKHTEICADTYVYFNETEQWSSIKLSIERDTLENFRKRDSERIGIEDDYSNTISDAEKVRLGIPLTDKGLEEIKDDTKLE